MYPTPGSDVTSIIYLRVLGNKTDRKADTGFIMVFSSVSALTGRSRQLINLLFFFSDAESKDRMKETSGESVICFPTLQTQLTLYTLTCCVTA